MEIPHDKSWLWPIGVSFVTAAFLVGTAVFLTKNGWSTSDAIQVLGTVSIILGVGTAKKYAAPPSPPSPPADPGTP